jgi:SAM-dependent methyltransferase
MIDAAGEERLRQDYRDYVVRTYRDHFGVTDAGQSAGVAQNWFEVDERHDGHFAALRQRAPEARRILDLASGMGTATLRGLAQGFDGYGIEPDAEKLGLMRRRIAAGGMPGAWTARFARAVGERLPYKDATFDAVLSYQTLEHVQNLDAVIAEMLRVVKPGGALHVRCPDYRSAFEGHYLIAWLPLMPRIMAYAYLRLRGRPVEGFHGIVYTTRPRIIRSVRAAAAHAGLALEVVDLERERMRTRLREKGLPAGRLMVCVAETAHYLRRLFRAETQVNLWLTRRA